MYRRRFLRQHGVGLGVIGVTWLIFFSRILFSDKVYFLDDLKIIYYPLEYAYAWFQAHGQLPLWSPYFGFGQPLLAWGQLGFFTPVHLVLRLFQVPPLTLLQASVIIYLAIGAVGMYAWLRKLQLAQLSASLGAIIFTFSGFTIGHLNHVNFYTATMLLPWLLWLVTIWLAQPTARRTALLGIIAAIMALSAQPQVVLYTYLVAGMYAFCALGQDTVIEGTSSWPRYLTPRVIWALIAGVLAFCLAALAILPVAEFLPLTERNDALTEADLLDFSYPPYHAITLVFPYFFGDHAAYWGPKGFQELAAFVGIIPLGLAGVALTQWRTHRRERLFAVFMLIVTLIFALGRYSPLYTYLVTEKILTSFSIPGRFVFFFDVAVATLAALGLHDVLSAPATRRQRLLGMAGSLGLLTLLFAPFFIQIQHEPRLYARFMSLPTSMPYSVGLVIAGMAALVAVYIGRSRPLFTRVLAPVLVILTSVTLLTYAWEYNPMLPRHVAEALSPFAESLREYTASAPTPARLYATNQAVVTSTTEQPIRLTDPLSPHFTVHQVITVRDNNLACVRLPLHITDAASGSLRLTIRPDFSAPPLVEQEYSVESLRTASDQHICFPPLPDSAGKRLVFSFTSLGEPGIHLLYDHQAVDAEPLYFVRVSSPTAEQLAASQKPLHLLIEQEYAAAYDAEAALLVRHLQSVVDTSGARWIGALSIRPYREFIETFFANDRDEVFDGDGRHAIVANRRLFDMAGITHIIQPSRPDTTTLMSAAGFTPVSEAQTGTTMLGLYQNPAAFPKTFMVRNAAFIPAADETRAALIDPTFDPRQTVYISGPTPPQNVSAFDSRPLDATTTITTYDPTRVDIAVDTPEAGWLVLTDTATPQWHTFIDDAPAAQYVAHSMFRAAQVPAGQHIVSFRYESPAVNQALQLTLAGIVGAAVLLLWPASWRPFRWKKS